VDKIWTKVLMAVMVTILGTTGFPACNAIVADDERPSNIAPRTTSPSDENERDSILISPSGQRLEIGFGSYVGGAPLGPIQYAVKSSGSVFNINNVTLDFYYGRTAYFDGTIDGIGQSNYRSVCFAIYFCDGPYYSQNYHYDYVLNTRVFMIYEDYHNVDGHYFLKELTIDEFNSDKYKCTIGWARQIDEARVYPCEIEFNHHETITIPPEIFERGQGSFVFQVAAVNYSKKDGGYCVVSGEGLVINYQFIDGQSVYLSEAYSKIPY